jgi:hypothetical protein
MLLPSPLMKRLAMILLLSLAILYNAGRSTAQATTDPVEGVHLNIHIDCLLLFEGESIYAFNFRTF